MSDPNSNEVMPNIEGAVMIMTERFRQIIEEGHTLEADQQQYVNKPGSLAMAGICYASHAASGTTVRGLMREHTPRFWPWAPNTWKPSADDSLDSRIRELTKAGALIAAEIDFLLAMKTGGMH